MMPQAATTALTETVATMTTVAGLTAEDMATVGEVVTSLTSYLWL